MRKYIRDEELSRTLQVILENEDPELREIYQAVARARLSDHSREAKTALSKILYPTRITLHLINLILLPLISVFFVTTLSLRLGSMPSHLILFAMFLYVVYSAFRLIMLLATFSSCRPYVLVDELFSRRILIIKKQRHTSVKTAK